MNQQEVNKNLIEAVEKLLRIVYDEYKGPEHPIVAVDYALLKAKEANDELHLERKNGVLAFKPAEFQSEKFYEHFRKLASNYTYRQIAAETGVSISTLSRIANGGKFEFENFIAICNWMELPITNYLYN